MRGMYRWFEGEGAAETWWARIERALGEWETVSQPTYEARGYSPPFWDLPLRDDYLEDALGRGPG